MTPNRRRLRRVLLVLAVLLVVSQIGCVRRRLTVRSNPPGALVYVDDQPIGTTPVSIPFVYYGTRKIQLIKDGYETETLKQNFSPPWYEVTPIDFFSENLWPGELRDERAVDVQLRPQTNVPPQQILERGEQLRQNANQGAVTPVPPSVQGGVI